MHSITVKPPSEANNLVTSRGYGKRMAQPANPDGLGIVEAPAPWEQAARLHRAQALCGLLENQLRRGAPVAAPSQLPRRHRTLVQAELAV